MDLDNPCKSAKPPEATLTPVSKSVAPDGLLLYLAEASYEAGNSPLSSWIPITGARENGTVKTPLSHSPLDHFQG